MSRDRSSGQANPKQPKPDQTSFRSHPSCPACHFQARPIRRIEKQTIQPLVLARRVRHILRLTPNIMNQGMLVSPNSPFSSIFLLAANGPLMDRRAISGPACQTAAHDHNPGTRAVDALTVISGLCQETDWQWVDGMHLGGCLAYGLGNYSKAQRWYNKVLELDPKYARSSQFHVFHANTGQASRSHVQPCSDISTFTPKG